MARARRKKKHICAECGESFNHGIGLRKHQRQTGHKGSEIVEEGDEPSANKVEAPAQPEPTPPQQAAPEPEPEPEPQPAAAQEEEEDDDQTVAVQRPGAPQQPDRTMPVGRPTRAPPHSSYAPPPTSKMRDTKTKLSLVSRGLKVVLSARAKDAGQQFKKSARSGADIFTEALKLAVALICFLSIPTMVFLWWKAQNPAPRVNPDRPEVFSFQDGALQARSALLTYLDHLGKEQWDQAYALLSPEWRQDFSITSFRDAFLDIEEVRWAVTDQRLNANGEADVLVRLAYREGGRPRRFVGRFRLIKGPQGWRIDRAELSAERRS